MSTNFWATEFILSVTVYAVRPISVVLVRSALYLNFATVNDVEIITFLS